MATLNGSYSSKKKQMEERNLKLLRELAAFIHNKQCFDCHQRGPTYVNMTIGSFVCTSCSGILRGLTPPHRVKSISMATFAPDEIEFLKAKGNDYCRKVWCGKYTDTRCPFDDGAVNKDDLQMKDYLALKYEKKRWYVDPERAFSNGSDIHDTPPPSPMAIERANSDLFVKAKPASSVSSNAAANALFDPFDDFLTNQPAVSNAKREKPVFAFHIPKSATSPSGFGTTNQSTSGWNQQLQPAMLAEQKSESRGNNCDKYSALAELDELFHTSASPAEVEQTKNGFDASKSSNGSSFAHPLNPIFNSQISTAPAFVRHPNSTATNPFANGFTHQNQNYGFRQPHAGIRFSQSLGNGFYMAPQFNLHNGMNPFTASGSMMRPPPTASKWNPFL